MTVYRTHKNFSDASFRVCPSSTYRTTANFNSSLNISFPIDFGTPFVSPLVQLLGCSSHFHVPPLTAPLAFADGQSRRESPKMAFRPFQFLMECGYKFGTICPEVRRGTKDGGSIYALSADETIPVLAAPCHAITDLFSCRFKCPCLLRRQRYFHSNADRAYNTLHFASKVVCQMGAGLWCGIFNFGKLLAPI